MIHLLNTAIIPSQAGSCEVRVYNLDLAQVEQMVCGNAFVSHIGHEGTARVLSQLLGEEIAMSREPWDGSGIGLAFQLTQRLGEGQVLTEEEVRALPFIFREIIIDPMG
jgi:hypothetical protein